MNEKIVELKEDAFESCIASDSSNNQKVIINKSGQFMAEFILKPISYGNLMNSINADSRPNEAKSLSSMIVQHKIKTSDGFKEGTTMTEDEVAELLPTVLQAIGLEAAKLIYISKVEEKNSETLSSG